MIETLKIVISNGLFSLVLYIIAILLIMLSFHKIKTDVVFSETVDISRHSWGTKLGCYGFILMIVAMIGTFLIDRQTIVNIEKSDLLLIIMTITLLPVPLSLLIKRIIDFVYRKNSEYQETQLSFRLGHQDDQPKIQGGIKMIQNDVSRSAQTIERLKNSVYELEVRKSDLINARAKLDKVVQRIAFENYSDQIAEIEKAVEEQNKEIYVKREELLSLIFGESGKIELIITKIQENLPTLSTTEVNEFFSQLVQLQTSLEQKGLPIPTELLEVKALAEKQDTSEKEKRAKIKFSLSLLGPKVEIEKDLADPNVRDIWKKFWKKAKEIALKKVF